jgi:UDP-3-O-[3-hydroxymyristoyl] N-acetylglucosamine deacetylase
VKQRTIAETVSCVGTGLHNGQPVQLTLRPASVDTGVVFTRTDRAHPTLIRTSPSAVQSTRRSTTLGCGEVSVGTVEHLCSALFGLRIDNVRVEVDGPELPIMDGSAAPFVYLLRSAGLVKQPAARRVLRIRQPLEIREGDRSIRIEPARAFRVNYAVEFDHPAIGRQVFRVDAPDKEHFERELSAARTFGFLHEFRSLWKAGYGRGGSLANTVVLDEKQVVNTDGLRWPDEFVRHKVLDLYGDLAVLGLPIQARIKVERGGHALHHKLVAAIVDHPEAWSIDDPDSRESRGLDFVPAPAPA